ncbi:MAG TPA: protein kinase [Gemmatimonadaceae bacterium]|nr:protein kinase [Gemmatimonadaceae bacterium]
MDDLRARLEQGLAPSYQVEREIGAGGMATVYLARDVRHERQVAIKVLREDLSASLGKERFVREIKIAAALQHPHVLPVYDSGEAGGLLFYVMPFVDGPSLRDKLVKEGELPITDAVRILRDVADALAEAHKHGVVHRDLKPENVMLRGRHALVTDFGVAKAVSEATGSASLTTVGIALGTPTYMAPEQATADPHVDHRADIYAFGVLAYELLTGRPPFTGASPQQILAAHITAPAEPVNKYRTTLSPALTTLVMKCLEKAPADRWQSAEELIPQLEALLTPSGGMTPSNTRPIAAQPARARTMMRASAATAIVAAIAAGLFVPIRTWLRDGRSVSSVSSGSSVDSVQSVAVLPFTEMNAAAGQAFFAEGLTDEVIVALSAIPRLRVPGRESSLRFKGSTAPIKAIADSLNVSMLLSATVERAAGSVRVRYQLVKSDGFQVLAGAITRPSSDVFAIYDSVSRAIAGKLALQLSPVAQQASVRQVNPEAYQAYLQGKVQFANRVMDSALVSLMRAAALDSMSAETWATLGIAHALSGPSDYNIARPEVAMANARRAVARALALDSASADAWTAAGLLASREFHWDEADQAYDRALRLNPAHPTALQFSATSLVATGRVADGVERIRAAERAEPLSFIIGDWSALIMWVGGQQQEALAHADRLLTLHPRSVRLKRDVAIMHSRVGDWGAVARLLSERELIVSNDSAAARRVRDGIMSEATRVATINAIAARDPSSMGLADMLMAAGDRANAIRAMLTRPARPGAFSHTIVTWVTNPELRRSPEFRKLMQDTRLPIPPES